MYLAKLRPVWSSLKCLSLGFHSWLLESNDIQPMFNGCQKMLRELSLCGTILFRQHLNTSLYYLQRLTLVSCYVELSLLGQLAPNLNHIELVGMKSYEFNVSKLDKQSGILSSLKSIFVFNCDLDVADLISRSSGSLEYLEIVQCKWLKVEQHWNGVRFPVLKSVVIRNVSGKNIMKLLARTTSTLENLELILLKSQVNFASLVGHGMPKLRSLNIHLEKKTENINKFIKACPQLNNLTIGFGYRYLNDTKLHACTLTKSLFILQPLLAAAKSTSLQRLYININVSDMFQYSQKSTELKLDEIQTLDYASIKLSNKLPAVIVKPFSSLFNGNVDIQVGILT